MVVGARDVTGKIEGCVARVTDDGDLVTDIDAANWTNIPRDSTVCITVDDEFETFGIYSSDHEQPAMTLIAIAENDDPLRLHLVGDSASMMLGVRAGASVKIVW